IDVLGRPFALVDSDAQRLRTAVGPTDLDKQRAFLVATHPESDRAPGGDAQATVRVIDLAARWHLAENHGALHDAIGKDDATGLRRRLRGVQRSRQTQADQPEQHQRSNSRRWPRTLSSRSLPFQTMWPLTKVAATLVRKVSPSNGDQAQRERISDWRTRCG